METNRLFLRERTTQLLEKVLASSTDEQLVFFGFDDVQQLQAELSRIEKRRASVQTDSKKWDLVEKATQKVLGSCGFHNWFVEHERAEIGYLLHANYWRKGFMFEALTAVIAHGFKEMNLNRIEAFVSPDNEPSRRIIRKLGFQQEGILREHYKSENQIHDSLVFSLLRGEYGKR